MRACASTLYSGQNSRGTSVFTWVSPSDQTSFDEDVSPLLQYLSGKGLVSADARLGLVEFGSEAYHSGGNVTFSAGGFSMEVWRGVPPRFDFNPIGERCARPTSPAGPEATGKPEKGSSGARAAGGPSGMTVAVAGTVSTMVVVVVVVGLGPCGDLYSCLGLGLGLAAALLWWC